MNLNITKATMGHIREIHQIIGAYAQEGIMLHRPLASLYEQVRDFSVAVDSSGDIVGVGALHVLWHDLAELRAFAVAPKAIGQGVGKKLVDHLLEEAIELGVRKIGLLTYEPDFFQKCGFERIEKEQLPLKVLRECIYCDNFESCTEVPMILNITKQGDNAHPENESYCSLQINVEVPLNDDEEH